MRGIVRNLKITLPIAVLIGFTTIFVNPGEDVFIGWLGSTVFSFLFLILIYISFNKLETPKHVRRMTWINFLLRFLIGITLMLLLPIIGYDEAPPQAGYLYLDAFRRDTDAWQIASSAGSVFAGFADEFTSDQYGGLLSLSALIYRAFSPDSHRPILILLLTAFISTIGIPFFWKAIQTRFGEKIANIASWILVLYPEGIILGGSQMREPLIIGLVCVLLWCFLDKSIKQGIRISTSIIVSTSIILLSTKYAAAIMILFAIWIWSDHLQMQTGKKWKRIGVVSAVGIAIIAILVSWNWLLWSARWDVYLMERSSGMVQYLIDSFGEQFRFPLIVTYGLFQPVLPAAIVYPGIPITRAISIFRSLGWYIIAPTLLISPFFVSKEKDKKDRSILIWTLVFVLFWIFLSSLRAGGDQWDNPRYRTIVLPWLAFISAWVIVYFKENKNPWLVRVFIIECFFILVFLQWYLSRYTKLWAPLSFIQIIAILVIGIVIILGISFFYDKKKRDIE